MFREGLRAWNTPHTILEGVPHRLSEIEPGPPVARKLVFVVVDGLGWDYASELETLAPLAQAGTLRPLDVPFPTYTAPSITSMFTGVAARESGVRLNGAAIGVSGLDDLVARTEEGGIPVDVRARNYGPFVLLSRAPIEVADSVGSFRFSFEVTTMTDDPGRRLIAVHLGEVDDAGHEKGADSVEYRSAALHAGVILQGIAAHLDPEQDVLIAASDHGHRPRGGHGGDEPAVTKAFLLAWGRDVRKGERLGPRPVRDIASTLAVTLGVHVPSSNMGRPMLDLFDLPDETKAKMLAEPFDQVTRFDCQISSLSACGAIQVGQEGIGRGDIALGEETIDGIASELTAALDRESRVGFTRRSLGALLFALGALILGSRARPSSKGALFLPLTAVAVYAAVLWGKGYGLTLSCMPPIDIFVPDAIAAGIAATVAIGFIALRHRVALREAIWLECVVIALVVGILGCAGADSRRLVHPRLAALLFEVAPLAVVGLSSVLVIAVADWARGRRDRRRAQ